MTRAYRHWCAALQFPGKAPFLFGTVQAETELEALRAAEVAWAAVFPIPMPAGAVMHPGTLAFHGDSE